MLLPLPLQNNIAGTGMARQLRKKSETGVYHVMLRGINRQDIFEDDEVFSDDVLCHSDALCSSEYCQVGTDIFYR